MRCHPFDFLSHCLIANPDLMKVVIQPKMTYSRGCMSGSKPRQIDVITTPPPPIRNNDRMVMVSALLALMESVATADSQKSDKGTQIKYINNANLSSKKENSVDFFVLSFQLALVVLSNDNPISVMQTIEKKSEKTAKNTGRVQNAMSGSILTRPRGYPASAITFKITPSTPTIAQKRSARVTLFLVVDARKMENATSEKKP